MILTASKTTDLSATGTALWLSFRHWYNMRTKKFRSYMMLSPHAIASLVELDWGVTSVQPPAKGRDVLCPCAPNHNVNPPLMKKVTIK